MRVKDLIYAFRTLRKSPLFTITAVVTFVSVGMLFLFIAAAASWIPAQRAAALDPTEALRDE